MPDARSSRRRNPASAEARSLVAQADAALSDGRLQSARASLEQAYPLIDRAYPAKWAADLLTRTAYIRSVLERMGVSVRRETPAGGWKSASQGRKMNPARQSGTLTKRKAADLEREARKADRLADQAARELSPSHPTVLLYRREATDYRRRAALIGKLRAAKSKRNPSKEEHAGLAEREHARLKSAMEYAEAALAGSYDHWEPAFPRALAKLSEVVALLERKAEHAGVRSWESAYEVDVTGEPRGPRWKHDYGATIAAAAKLQTRMERRMDEMRESRMSARANPRRAR